MLCFATPFRARIIMILYEIIFRGQSPEDLRSELSVSRPWRARQNKNFERGYHRKEL
jgi:hypothetical protein